MLKPRYVIQAAVPKEMFDEVERLAKRYHWKPSEAIRWLVQFGLNAARSEYAKDLQPEETPWGKPVASNKGKGE